MTPYTPTIGPASASISHLLQRFGGRWLILYEPNLRVWSAERKSPDGRHRRFLAEHSPQALADLLADAETAEP